MNLQMTTSLFQHWEKSWENSGIGDFPKMVPFFSLKMGIFFSQFENKPGTFGGKYKIFPILHDFPQWGAGCPMEEPP